jgi:hypothetical protein
VSDAGGGHAGGVAAQAMRETEVSIKTCTSTHLFGTVVVKDAELGETILPGGMGDVGRGR